MGAVYKGIDQRAGKGVDPRVACKRVVEQWAGDPEYVQRLRREAKHLEDLWQHNTAIVPFVAHFEDPDGQPWLVTRWMAGGSLRDRLVRGVEVSREVLVRDLARIAGALDDAARVGMAHRDVKPANILYSEDRKSYLSDFGIAQASGDSALTAQGAFIGSLQYASPERQRGGGHRNSDQYSLAIVAVECLLGDRGRFEQWLKAHVELQEVALRSLRRSLPLSVDVVVKKAAHVNPALRYDDCSSFVGALAKALGVDAEADWSSSSDRDVRDGLTVLRPGAPNRPSAPVRPRAPVRSAEAARPNQPNRVRVEVPREPDAGVAALRELVGREGRAGGRRLTTGAGPRAIVFAAVAALLYFGAPQVHSLWGDAVWDLFGREPLMFARGEQFGGWLINGALLGGGVALMAQWQNTSRGPITVLLITVFAAVSMSSAAVLAWSLDKGALGSLITRYGAIELTVREHGVTLLAIAIGLGCAARYLPLSGVPRRLVYVTAAALFIGCALIGFYEALAWERPGEAAG